ncbi:hypothetical protein [Methylobacterium sp. 77]|uniref:hypothetical protein n=1 Tax=Methylobacterium sp. 77 TaxID=1101192 RepID=UPI0012DF29A4|nr:hypothetical protein [Methylobacterium sp. 77]
MPDQTPTGIVFSPWPTDVESDDLWLGRLSFDVGTPLVIFAKDNISYSLPSTNPNHDHSLEADFVSTDKKAVIRFAFQGVIAFRMLDENGLLELWEASNSDPRSAKTTFRARGHKWSDESFLVFMAGGSEQRSSYFIATEAHCLEVVCDAEPSVTNIGPALVSHAEPKD